MRFGVTCHFESIHRSVNLIYGQFFAKKFIDHCFPARVLWGSSVQPNIPVQQEIVL